MDTTILEVRHIRKRFLATQALDNVSLSFRRGTVHAIVGENGAGKSTLMNIVGGVHQNDEGEILLDGAPVVFKSPHDAMSRGIGFVHQEIALCQHISVAENIYMAQLGDGGRRIIDFRSLQAKAGELLGQFETQVNPLARVGDLSVSQQQVVEIVKALSMNCKVIIFDEPTASLTEQETERLFSIIANLKARGLCVLYISHRLSEIFRICDEVSVLRDGRLVRTEAVAKIDQAALMSSMVGRDLADIYPPKARPEKIGEPLLEVEGLAAERSFRGISFSLRRGEILGFAGLVGSGRTEVARTICGIYRRSAGSVRLSGTVLDPSSYREAISRGLVYLTEDRKTEGLFLEMSIASNISVMGLSDVSPGGLVDSQAEERLAEKFMSSMAIKAAGPAAKARSLSGGNQQKVLISKLLSVSPKVVFMDEPTRGIDVGAKTQIYTTLRRLADEGVGVVVISSELPEIIGLCDRVVVMNEGRMCGLLEGDDICEHKIISMACLEAATVEDR
jgi:ribose transport system ATP-binding protein